MSVSSPSVTVPAQGYYTGTPAAPARPAPAASPTPSTPANGSTSSSGSGGQAALDLARIMAHPIQTVKSLVLLTRDVVSLQFQHNLTLQNMAPAVSAFQRAQNDLSAAPFQHLLPFFGDLIDSWANGRFNELDPQVQSVVTTRATHPIVLDWPDGGTGSQKLGELLMINTVIGNSTDGQVIRGLQGANRLQVVNSSLTNYLSPIGRSGDALQLRRNLPILPGQSPLDQSFQNYLVQSAKVSVQLT